MASFRRLRNEMMNESSERITLSWNQMLLWPAIFAAAEALEQISYAVFCLKKKRRGRSTLRFGRYLRCRCPDRDCALAPRFSPQLLHIFLSLSQPAVDSTATT